MSLLAWLSNAKAQTSIPSSKASSSANDLDCQSIDNQRNDSDIESNTDSEHEQQIPIRKSKITTENPSAQHWPDCWTNEMRVKKCDKYQWLFTKNKKIGCNICKEVKQIGGPYKKQGMQLSHEWVNSSVDSFGTTEKEQRQSLRKKIFKHKNSAAHKCAEKVILDAEHEILKSVVVKGQRLNHESTEYIFRTVYNIAKKGRPFTDLPLDVDMQMLNGVKMGRILQTDHSCANIACHIANNMKNNIVQTIIKNKSKIAVLIDESTSVSKSTVLVICLKAFVPNTTNNEENKNKIFAETESPTFFLDLVELENTASSNILNSLLSCLEQHGFTHEYLYDNLVCFASDGASNMIGKKSGVATLLGNKYPDIIMWHCSNHRLELAVGDVVNEVAGINHFKIFVDKLYSLYSASPKNQYELKACAIQLEMQILSIGRILSTRWVASSFRTIKAVWNNYRALHQHFEEASNDKLRQSVERAKYSGLKERLTETAFVHNLYIV